MSKCTQMPMRLCMGEIKWTREKTFARWLIGLLLTWQLAARQASSETSVKHRTLYWQLVKGMAQDMDSYHCPESIKHFTIHIPRWVFSILTACMLSVDWQQCFGEMWCLCLTGWTNYCSVFQKVTVIREEGRSIFCLKLCQNPEHYFLNNACPECL